MVCGLQESLSSCGDILSLAGRDNNHSQTDIEEEEEEEEHEEVEREDHLETLKSLTETVMSMIECSNKATRRADLKGRNSMRGTAKMDQKLELNNHHSINKEQQAEEEKEEKEQLDQQFKQENNYENYVNYFKSKGILFPRSMWTTTGVQVEEEKHQKVTGGCEQNVFTTKHDNKQRLGLKLALNLEEMVTQREAYNNRAGGDGSRMEVLNEEEDCEYDSERGKFNCDAPMGGEIEEGGEVDLVETKEVQEIVVAEKKKDSLSFNANNVSEVKRTPMVNKKIEYFENKLKPSKEDNRLKEVALGGGGEKRFREEEGRVKEIIRKEEEVLEKRDGGEIGVEKGDEGKLEVDLGDEERKKMINILCLGSFFMTALLLYLFPLPN